MTTTHQGLKRDDLGVLRSDHRPEGATGSDASDRLPPTAYEEDLYGGELTLYDERKSLLINRELDAMGLGRYQKCIWLLCGFGYMLDLLWAQASGLIATPLYQELKAFASVDRPFTHLLSGVATDTIVLDGLCANIFTAFSAGLTVGAFTFGLGVDVIGRKWCFNLTCLVTSIFGLLVAAPSNYDAICALTALCGFGLGGNIPIDATIVPEFLPQNRRWLLPLLSMWQPIGVVLNCAIAFSLVPRYRCNTDLLACGLVQFRVFVLRFFVFDFLESPKYLLARERDAEAIEVVHKLATFNRTVAPQLSIAEFEAIDHEFPQQGLDTSKKCVIKQAFGRFKPLRGLFRTKRLGLTTVLLWIVYMDCGSGPFIGSLWYVLRLRSVDSIYVYLSGILGTILAAACVELPGVGRKWSLVFGAIVQGVSMAMYTQMDTIKVSVHSTSIRGVSSPIRLQPFSGHRCFPSDKVQLHPYLQSAAGLCSTFGRLAGIVAPIAARPYIDGNSNGVLWLAVGGIFVSAFFLIFLPIETRAQASFE
ncbi:BZ3500_MvSof-1268-A1-R1_Chr8-1g09930 [Microbotryum saponariae]|uniref:BZ3500_MvSof-1268-A1-R1_Chr8-1g09930 protein n=1 Tax=Microbotryum saponariae TaxID=289078 RepID=A0A2X0MNV5_9BASI|nr:BZ3500_MvSof-1268-A1-R1_Chr8-1g09930 [Microbotryum saponariae]SDA08216.1 BZ3501_MvSof-1269-A2-R1_Chr8-1g09653 [Microbotryum saponariae]